MDPLVTVMTRVRQRLFLRQWLRFTALSIVYAASSACVWLLITRIFPVLGDPAPVLVGLAVVAAVVATVLTWIRRPTLVDAAVEADARLHLHERFTSSLELAGVDGPMVPELHADARAHLGRLHLRRDFPIVVTDRARWAYVPLLLFGMGYLFLPEFDLFGFEARQAEARIKAERVQMQVQRLTEAAKPLKEAAALTEGGPLGEAAALVNQVAEQLELGEITEKQALAKLNDLREVMQARQDSLQNSVPTPKTAADPNDFESLGDLAKALTQQDFGKAEEKLKELQEKLEKGEMSQEELEKIAQDIAKLSQLLGIKDAALAEALAKAGQCLKAGNCKSACAALAKANLSLTNLAELMKRLDEMAKAGMCLGGCCNKMCGGIRPWKAGESLKFSLGSGGAGHGNGHVDRSTNPNVGFEDQMIPGPMGQGPMELGAEELAAPDSDAKPTVDYIQGTFVEARQAAEQALEQEEIPRASQEFVRQYFGTMENQK